MSRPTIHDPRLYALLRKLTPGEIMPEPKPTAAVRHCRACGAAEGVTSIRGVPVCLTCGAEP